MQKIKYILISAIEHDYTEITNTISKLWESQGIWNVENVILYLFVCKTKNQTGSKVKAFNTGQKLSLILA